jgi:hypothetical protein
VTNRTGVPRRALRLLLAFVAAAVIALLGWDAPAAHAQTL